MFFRARSCWIALLCLLLAVPAGAGEIHRAISQGDEARVAELLRADPQLIRAQDENRTLDFPLHTAAIAGNVGIARLLLDAGADVDCGDADGSTPLHDACQLRKREMVDFLLSRGADPGRRDNNGAYSLSFATAGGDSAIVRTLLNAGVDLDYQDSANGNTLMHMACSRGLFWFVDLLKDRGLDINARNRRGETPVGWVCQGRFPRRLEMTLDRGGDLNTATPSGFTPLHVACWNWNNQPDFARILVARGANVNAADTAGTTPIFGPAMRGDAEMVRMLLDHGANPRARTHSGNTPLSEAAEAGHASVVEMLLAVGSPTDGREPSFGWTPLHRAAALGYRDVADLLATHGADLDAKDNAGRTPMQLAEQYGQTDLAAQLKARGAQGSLDRKPHGLAGSPRPGPDEAQIWYLGHSAWGIRTSNHFLVFDYGEMGRRSDQANLDSGDINPSELAAERVTVLVSHGHGDHYIPAIFDWRTQIPQISYVLGFQPQDLQNSPAYEQMDPRQSRVIDGMKVTTTGSTDAGVGFLVEVDGLSIFHPGDLANMTADLSTQYKDEIDWLAQSGAHPDISFAPLVGCGATAQGGTKVGAEYFLAKMRPKALFPMHGGLWGNRYVTFIAELDKDASPQTRMLAALCKGDHFRYSNGKAS